MLILKMSWKYLSDLELDLIQKEHSKGVSGKKIGEILNRDALVINRCIKRGVSPGKRNTIEIDFKPEFKELLEEFIGAFAGDGNFYLKPNGGYRTSLFLNEKESAYANYLKNVVKNVFGFYPRIWHYKRGHMIYLVIQRKRVYQIIRLLLNWSIKNKTYTIGLVNDLQNYDSAFLKGFIRGLISTDGSVSYKGNKKLRVKVEFSSTSKRLINQYVSALKLFGIPSNMYYKNNNSHSIWSVEFSRKTSVENFYNNIGLNESLRSAKLKTVVLYNK